jgi:hypothetical protein
MFPSMGTLTLNLRNDSAFFASNQQRFKTTPCKLYQIPLILVTFGIMERTDNPCQVELKPPFTGLVLDDSLADPFALASLFVQSMVSKQAVEQRKTEFQTFASPMLGS